MEEDSSSRPVEQSQSYRIDECEVCSKNKAKYTCPRCELRTCCLECINIHKKELECNGIRDKVKFKMLKNFDNIDLLNDYRLLEETARAINKPIKLAPTSCYNLKDGSLPTDLYRLKCTAAVRGVQLHFLPPNFTRHHTNTTYLDHSTQNLYWRIDWIFPQAGNLKLTDDRVLDSSLLSTCIAKYIEPDEVSSNILSFYQAAGHLGIKLLLQAERVAPNRYYMLDPTSTLRENLYGKSIIEYPVIYVVLSDHIYTFNVLNEEEEDILRKKQRRRYRPRKKKTIRKDSNFLFPNSKGEDGCEETVFTSDVEEHSDEDNISDHIRPSRGHNRFYRQRMRRGNFRNRWNRNQNRMQYNGHSSRNTSDFSENSINSSLSSNLNSVNIH